MILDKQYIILYRGKIKMPKKEHHNSQDSNQVHIPNLDFEINNYWSPYIETELLSEIKASRKARNNPYKSELKSICLLIGVIGLLSIGICVQADSIAQALREIFRTSAEQTIQVQNQ